MGAASQRQRKPSSGSGASKPNPKPAVRTQSPRCGARFARCGQVPRARRPLPLQVGRAAGSRPLAPARPPPPAADAPAARAQAPARAPPLFKKVPCGRATFSAFAASAWAPACGGQPTAAVGTRSASLRFAQRYAAPSNPVPRSGPAPLARGGFARRRRSNGQHPHSCSNPTIHEPNPEPGAAVLAHRSAERIHTQHSGAASLRSAAPTCRRRKRRRLPPRLPPSVGRRGVFGR